MWSVLEAIGRGVAIGGGVALLCVAVALGAGALAARGHRAPLKRFSLLVLEFLYLPLAMLFAALAGAPSLDAMMVALRNRANRARFRRARSRVLLAPACLRHIECRAPTGRQGILCTQCGLCKLGKVQTEGVRLGYRVFILTGSAYIPRLLAEERPGAALLVACPHECNKVMMALGRLATVAVFLDRDGCVNTDVSLDAVIRTMRLGLEAAGPREGADSSGAESLTQTPEGTERRAEQDVRHA